MYANESIRVPSSRRALTGFVPVLVMFLSTGCGATIRAASVDVPRQAVPVTIDEMLKAGEDARTRERVAQILETPEMQRAIASVAKTAISAAIAEGASEATDERLGEMVHAITRALAQAVADDIVPAMVASTRDSIRESFSARDRQALEGALSSLAATSTTAALHAAAKEIPTTLGPAVRESLVRELEAPDLREAVSGLVGDAAKRVVESTKAAVAEPQPNQNAKIGKGGLIGHMERLVTYSWLIVLAVGVLGAALVAWLLRVRRRNKRYRAAIVDLMSRAKDDGEEREKSPQLKQLLELLQ